MGCAGRRYPLQDLLLIAVAAMLAGHRNDALNAVAGMRIE